MCAGIATTSLIPAIIKPQMKDANAVYIYIQNLALLQSRLHTNRSSTAGRIQSFISNLTRNRHVTNRKPSETFQRFVN